MNHDDWSWWVANRNWRESAIAALVITVGAMALFFALVLISGCSHVPMAAQVGGTVGCAYVDDQERTLLESIVPQLLAATPAERRRALEAPDGFVAQLAPTWFGAAWYALHAAFREQSSLVEMQSQYDAAIESLLRGCASALRS